MYAEGGDFGYSNNTNELWPYFGASYLDDGQATGNVSALNGVSGTFAAGLSFSYPFGTGPDSYVDVLGSAGGTVWLTDQASRGRAVHHRSSSWRTVLSAVIYGALSAERRSVLLAGIANYLLYGTAIARPEPTPAVGRIGLAGNPVRAGRQVALLLPPDCRGPVAVFDAAGRQLNGCFDERSSSITVPAAGCYVVSAGGQALPFTAVK